MLGLMLFDSTADLHGEEMQTLSFIDNTKPGRVVNILKSAIQRDFIELGK